MPDEDLEQSTRASQQVLHLHHATYGEQRDQTPLLLIHGGAGVIEEFDAIAPALAEERLVVAVELQGHGRTPHADRPYTAEANAADVFAVLDRLALDPVDVLSFSNGCLTALRMAAQAPERIGRMIIASGFARRDGMVEGFWEQFDSPDPAAMPPDLVETYRRIAPDPSAVERMFWLDVEMMRAATDTSDADLAALTAPMLFLSGDHDIVRPEHTLELARLVADGRAAVVPGAHGDYLGMEGMGDAGVREGDLVEATIALIRGFLSAPG